MNVIAIANKKGGVGKTCTAVNLAHGAALRGRSVLVVDLDPQGNVADSLGLAAGCELKAWLGDGRDLRVIAAYGRYNLSVVRSDKTTVGLKMTLADDGMFVLREALEPISWYDLVILDCAPSLDVMHTAALFAADWLIVPTRLDQIAVKGVGEILRTLATVIRRGGRCSLAGILPTFYDRQTTESQRQLEHLAQNFGKQLWPPIPQDAKIRTANRAGKTLFEYAPASRAVMGIDGIGGGYLSVLDRLIKII
jgi:chromosome partitioning protein